MPHDIFLSYSRKDRDRAVLVVRALELRNWSIWWDPTIEPGETWDEVIEAALDEARCVIVLWSRDSVQSRWVRTEADEGQRRGILVPALLDEVRIPLAFRSMQAANLVDWSGALPHGGFEVLARVVARKLSSPLAVVQTRANTGTAQVEPPAPITGEGAVIASGSAPAAGQTRVNPKDGLTYVWIPPGKFTMGCSPGDSECYPDESPPHQVSITRGFWLGQTPVTQEAYERVIGSNPSHFKGARLPVETVSWDDAQAYCEAVGMRLPTEAEWEYAARAGSAAPRYGELDQIAWYSGNSGSKTHEVGQKQPNAFGLNDMLGNVLEWVADWYGAEYYGQSPPSDPPGPASGQYRVLRGGSWSYLPWLVRASDRVRGVPTNRLDLIGFRCAGELR